MAVEPKFHIIEKHGPITVWKFSNPPQNLMNLQTGAELVELVEEFEADPDARVAVYTSAMDHVFIQHFDVSTECHSIARIASFQHKCGDRFPIRQRRPCVTDGDDRLRAPSPIRRR